VPAVTVDGSQVRFSPTLEVTITDGAPTVQLDVPATDSTCYATVTIEPTPPSTQMGRCHSGPVLIPEDATSLADLIQVDPATYQPTPTNPTLDALIQQRIVELTRNVY